MYILCNLFSSQATICILGTISISVMKQYNINTVTNFFIPKIPKYQKNIDFFSLILV